MVSNSEPMGEADTLTCDDASTSEDSGDLTGATEMRVWDLFSCGFFKHARHIEWWVA
jgi:hypothetical protein